MAEGMVARVGRWCFRRKWWVVAIWVAAIVVGGLASGPVFDGLTGDGGPKSLESVQAGDVLQANSNDGGTVTAVVDKVDPRAAAVRDAVRAAGADLSAVSGVTKVVTPYDEGLPATTTAAMTARDGHAVLIQVSLANLPDDAVETTVDKLSARLHQLSRTLAADGQPGATVLVGGGPVIDQQANAQAGSDLSRAEELSLPITLVILIFVFGGLIAAAAPVLAALISVFTAMAGLFVFARFTSLDSDAVTVVTLLGLGLSIDYGLLLIARYREELAAGFARDVAVGRAWATAGRTILFSALTVAAALTGLFLFGVTGLSAMGAAGVSVALVAMLVALTFTGAVIGIAGRWIRPSKRAARRVARYGDAAEVGFFARLARIVQRRPLVTMVATAAALIAAGFPMLSMTVHIGDASNLPRSLESVRVLDVLSDRFGQAQAPAVTVVARTDAATLDTWAQRWTGTPGVVRVHPAQQVGPNLSTVDIDSTGDPQGTAALRLVDRVRADRPTATQSWVTGDAAVLKDVTGRLYDRLPYAVGVTVLAMMLLLFAMTGSVVVPVKAMVMNVVSLGATFGVMNAVFEHGFLAGPLHTLTVNGVDPFVIVTVFAFAFGLSMDYEVFLLGRIKEYVDRGLPTDMAVRRGMQRSGRIITSAALLMVVVFSCFVTGRMGTVQQIGLGLAVAVAIDATVVRCVLVPATMTLLGRWNWWAPRWLKRVHARVGLHETVLAPVPVPVLPEPALR
ncbi:MMPL family transporter [Rugosimonospora africana]|uniref:Putative membrane protein n=1 Tax=Rugosimonospora africana TaxID=556532 RepID=A0A8J3QL59_9ACTN|nr:MMPL family transporter [Rugosimonospora africana]GIH12616.1 putative membrane protein [Rugosimonospora africana]